MNKHGFFHRFLGSCHQRKGDWLVKRATKKLGLDAEQQDKLSHFNQQFQHGKADIETVRRDSRHEIVELLFEKQDACNKAKALMHEKITVIVAHTNEIVDAFGDFTDSLNPQQRQQLHNYMNKHKTQRACCH